MMGVVIFVFERDNTDPGAIAEGLLMKQTCASGVRTQCDYVKGSNFHVIGAGPFFQCNGRTVGTIAAKVPSWNDLYLFLRYAGLNQTLGHH